jgi:acyl-coenzyme A synthetase/AMP-(fatty) acid ligase
MGDTEPWLAGAADGLARSPFGLVHGPDRVPWPELLRRARALADTLPGTSHGWVVPADGTPAAVVGLLAVGLADPPVRWLLGDPDRWSGGHPLRVDGMGPALWPAEGRAAPPPDVDGPTYATASSGTTGVPKLLFGRPAGLPAAVRLYTEGMPEYRDAEVFAACSAADFAAAFYMVVVPAVTLGRDLVLFGPRDWPAAARTFANRPGICLAAPSLAVLGARAVGRGHHDRTSVVPAGGGLTVRRAERIQAGFRGCGFLTMLGATETGLLTVTREVREDGYVGHPLPGKPVWLADVGPDGVGTLWTRGPDTRFAVTGGSLATRPDGAVSTGDLAHRHPGDGGFVLDGRANDLIKVDGVSVYPRAVVAALRAVPGVVDASVSVDRSGVVDRVTITVVGDATEERVRAACAALPRPFVPHLVRHHAEELAYSDRGKVRR